MSGGTSEIHRDTEPLLEVTHRGATGATTFRNNRYKFDVLVRVGLYAENPRTGDYGTISSVSPHEIEIDWVSEGGSGDLEFSGRTPTFGSEEIYFSDPSTGGIITWRYGDTLKVYKTAVKGGFISKQWVDLSAGWKTPMEELVDGWREEDRDLNPDGEREIWGEGQPENYRR